MNRREWLSTAAGSIAWSAVADAQEHARHAVVSAATSKFEFFDPAAAREIAVIAAQIMPTTETPGATEAGVIYFIDRALRTFDIDKQRTYRDGLAEMKLAREKKHPGSTSFAELSPEQQSAMLHEIDKSPFFEQVRFHTMLGMFGHPSYGGNRDRSGWKLIGFEDRMAWQPPFGFYDGAAK